MFTDEYLYAIALKKCNFIGDATFKILMEASGSAENIWKLSKKDITAIFGIGTKKASEIGNPEHLRFAEKELEFCQRHQIKINLRHLGHLPQLLQDCEDAPSILYQKGKNPIDKSPISIVGTRNITAYGKTFINDFLEEIKKQNIVTISGLALGVDTEVHEKSLEKNIDTIAVLAHGFHTLYPSKNRELSEKILENGGTLYTEFNTSQKPDRENFIQRNRIIAGLSPTTIVVETAFGGGSISTVSYANSYNREVFALPGRITDKYSQGCNQIIAQNKAATISTIKGLAKDLGLKKTKDKIGSLFSFSEVKPQLSTEQSLIYDTIANHALITLDELAEKTEHATFKILPILLELEILGLIKSFSGRQFQAI